MIKKMNKQTKDLRRCLKCSYIIKDLYLEYINSYNKSINKYSNNPFF